MTKYKLNDLINSMELYVLDLEDDIKWLNGLKYVELHKELINSRIKNRDECLIKIENWKKELRKGL